MKYLFWIDLCRYKQKSKMIMTLFTTLDRFYFLQFYFACQSPILLKIIGEKAQPM